MKSLNVLLTCCALVSAAMAEETDYPFQPVPFTDVSVEDSFWTPRLETNRLTTVWYDYQKCEETGRIDNFAKAAKRMPGPHKGDPFDDSDVYKVIEGAAYTIALHPDPKLEAYTDALIDKIAAAQEPDGYLYTARTINPTNAPGRASKARWLNERGALGNGDSHELYNAGHMYEAAVAYFQATGKQKFLTVALNHADLVAKTWGPGTNQLKIPSGHQEIEIGLVKLYRVTGDKKYLDLAKFLLDCRGRHFDVAKRKPDPYYSDHKPVTEQTEAVGHAVRSAYMYSGMADVAALTGDTAYLAAIDRLWENVVAKKMHLTGGIGASPAGEAFGANYDLPNASAYLETCAAIANALWNERMFRLHGDAQYIDVLERIIYNGFLSGLSMTGNRFFYPNPLESDGQGKFNHGSCERAPWFGCSCCPVNDVRFIPEIASFVYATHGNALYVNLFMGGTAKLDLAGTILEVKQVTRYPWDGKVTLTLLQVARPGSNTPGQEFTLNVRIPGWARNQPVPSDLYRYEDSLKPQVKLAVNGKSLTPKLENGFAQITRSWEPGDTVTLELEMPVRRVVAHASVAADHNRFALERGPLVYCAEGADNAGQVLDKIFPGKIRFETQERSNLLGGIVTVKLISQDSADALTCIPYYAWCHRGANEMRVWFPTKAEIRLASHCWELDSVAACFDGKEPQSSNDGNIPRFTWWDHRGSSEWVMRPFDKPTQVSAASVYWFDDTGAGACRAPKSWRLLYQDGKEWKPVTGASAFGTQLNQYNRVTFDPVTTAALRLEVQLQPEFSGGILEWK